MAVSEAGVHGLHALSLVEVGLKVVQGNVTTPLLLMVVETV